MNSVVNEFVDPPRRTSNVETTSQTTTSDIGQTNDSSKTPGEQQHGSVFSTTLNTIQKASSIAGLMRMCGAGLLVFSLSLFLIQGIEATSDLQRYFLLLAQTTLLTIAGFAIGFLLKEPRGARVFFGLGLASIPANFAVLGAMIYSVLPMDAIVATYPSYATWHSGNVSELLIAGIAGTVVLIPMSLFCFAVFARQSKFWLSAGYLLSSASLLIPLRDALSITLLSSVMAITMVLLLTNLRKNTTSVFTAEQRFAHALLFAPALLMLARSAMLYSVDFHFTLALVISSYYLLRQGVIRLQKSSGWAGSIQLSTITTAIILSGMLTSLVTSYVPLLNETVLFSVLLAALFVELSRMMGSARLLSVMQIAWSLLTVASLMLDYLMWNGSASIITSVIIAAIIMACGVLTRQAFSAVMGLLALVGQLVFNGSELIASLLSSGWMGMAITGASIIVLGSLIERFWPLIRLRFVTRGTTSSVDAGELDTSTLPTSTSQ